MSKKVSLPASKLQDVRKSSRVAYATLTFYNGTRMANLGCGTMDQLTETLIYYADEGWMPLSTWWGDTGGTGGSVWFKVLLQKQTKV